MVNFRFVGSVPLQQDEQNAKIVWSRTEPLIGLERCKLKCKWAGKKQHELLPSGRTAELPDWSSPPSPVFESLSPSDRPVVPRPPQPQAYSQSRMPLPPTSSSMSAQSDSWRPVKPYKQSQSQRSSQRSSQNSAGGQDLEEGELA
ncbi:hypothetical protein Ddc_14069 [Ditylenchus destructor]|nr:hypothetical protein Ddc_14069 [Ditylenchus destructor]